MFSFFFILFWWIPKLLVTVPPDMVNLPHKEYWLAEENRERAVAIFSALLHEFGAVILLFFALVGVLTTWANLEQPIRLDNTLFLGGLVAFLAYTGWWCVRLYRAFRIPER